MRIHLEKALYVLRNEGFSAFLKQALLFLTQSLFFDRTYYLYVGSLEEVGRVVAKPQIDNPSLQTIRTNREVEELSAEGYILKPWYPEYRNRLDKGVTAYCAFAGKQMAHINWCATTEEGMRALGEPPYRIDFASGEIAWGDYWTHPEYRGKSVAHYAICNIQQYLRDSGKRVTRGVIRTSNRPSQRVPRDGDGKIAAIVRHRKILFWQSCKETPVPEEQ